MEELMMSKTKILSLLLVFCMLTIIGLSLHIYKLHGYKQSVQYLFGEDKYFIEETIDKNKNRTKIYTLETKTENGFSILEKYMNNLGYFNIPEKQYAVFYTFRNKDGYYADVEGFYENRGYVEWDIFWHFKK